ncbi:MAG: aminopeptidase P N-terminal domain-containing protein, partial [Paraglaciecola sp.]
MNTTDFSASQQRLMKAMSPNSIAIVPAASLVTRSRDTEFPFRQDSYFQYLIGFPEPDAYLVLSNHCEYKGGLSVLFCLDKDPLQEIWHGRRFGPKQAKEQFA